MDQSFSEQMEAVQQELHSARQQINILNANVAHLTAENSDLHHELSNLSDQGKDDRVRLKSASDLCQVTEDKVLDLTERLQSALEEKESADRKVEELTDLVASLQNSNQSDAGQSSVICACEADTAVLREQLDLLGREMEMKNNQLSDAVSDLHKAVEKSVNLKAEMEELQSEVECLHSQISSQSSIIQCQREELDGMRSMAESESSCIDTNMKGNSLFSEVEDRRVIAETKMVKVLDKASKLETRLKKEQKENQRLKNQISLLMRSSNTASDKTVRRLEQEVEDSKKQVLSLTEQLTQLQQQQQQQLSGPTRPMGKMTQPPVSDASPNQTALVSYLRSTISHLQKERESLKKEADNLRVEKVQLDFLWTQKKNEVRALVSEKDKLSALNAHQALVIEGLKDESESADDAQPKEKVKITQNNQTGARQETDSPTEPLSEVPHRNKENSPTDLRSYILGCKSTKSVAFSAEADVLSECGNRQTENVKEEESVGGGRKEVNKLKTGGGGCGKYRSVSYATMEESEVEAPECKQQ